MTQSHSLQDDVCKKLRLVGLPKVEVIPLVNLITRQVAAEGPESVVKRLKVLKQGAINLLAGQPVHLDWIAHNQHGPKGPWRPVWNRLKSSNFKQRRKALNALMVYASLVLPEKAAPTRAQEQKFLGSVEHSDEEIQKRSRKVAELLDSGALRPGFARLMALLDKKGWNPSKRGSIPDFISYAMSKKGSDSKTVHSVEKRLERFLGSDAGRPFHSFPEVKQTLGALGEDYFSLTHPWNGAHLDWREQQPATEPIGVIGSTQEPGFKFRAFASPYLVLQSALEGMKSNLLEALKSCPWDCTHDQEKGVLEVQKLLREGRTMFSVDLSDATNNFPLEVQILLLKRMRLPASEIKLLELVSRSPYGVTWDKGRIVRWDVGQPLGAGPSFMSFALSHAVVALAAEARAGVPASAMGSTFRILGDDFITCDEKVHEHYRQLLTGLSCPISESKCLISPLAGEFAGKLITKDSVYHGYKYRALSDLSFMPVLRSLGKQAVSRKLLSKEQYAYAKLMSEVPEPWGLGFNPRGRPYAKRYEEYLTIKDNLKQFEGSTSKSRPEELVNKFVYQVRHKHWRYLSGTKVSKQDRLVASEDESLRRTQIKDVKQRVEHSVRNTSTLVATTLVGGDPRPNPLKEWRKRHLDRVKPILDTLRGETPVEQPIVETEPVVSSTVPDSRTSVLGKSAPSVPVSRAQQGTAQPPYQPTRPKG